MNPKRILFNLPMNLRLSNYGHRFAKETFSTPGRNLPSLDVSYTLLLDLWTGILIPDQGQPGLFELEQRGFVERVPESITKAETELRYRRNPLEHVTKIIFELTTFCNFNCQHCYNATVPRSTEQDIPALKKAVDVFRAMDIERFDFIGGEVTKYANGWLDLARHCRQQGAKIVTIYTNGWWLEQKTFTAAGKSYPDVSTYLADLREHGVTHILFSLDGPEDMHDRSRGHPGLYHRVLSGIPMVKAAGLLPRISLLMRKDSSMDTYVQLLDTLAQRIYDFPDSTDVLERVNHMVDDPTNTLSNLIDVGNQAAHANSNQGFYLWQPTDQQLYCRGFYRPIKPGETAQIVASDPNGAWLLLLHRNTLGWMPTIYLGFGSGTLNASVIDTEHEEPCSGYLGSITSILQTWESNISGTVKIQGIAYLPASYIEANDWSVVEEGTGIHAEPEVRITNLQQGGRVERFTIQLDTVSLGDKLSFFNNENGQSTIPFQASFFSTDCSGPIASNDSTISPTRAPTIRVITLEVISTSEAVATSDPWSTGTGEIPACAGALPARLEINEDAEVCTKKANVFLRSGPGKQYDPLIKKAPTSVVWVMDGPVCKNSTYWWKVKDNAGRIGWMAEGSDSTDPYYLCPN